MRQLKIPKIWRRAQVVAVPKPEKPLGIQRASIPYLCCVFPLKNSRDSSTLVSNQSSTHCSHRSRRVSHTGGRQQTRSPCWHRTSRTVFRLKRPELCLSTSQQPTTLRHRGLTCKLLQLLPDKTYGPHDHGDGWQSQLHPHHWKRQKKQVTTPHERRPTGICPGTPSFQHHLWLANHRLHMLTI